jgi:hypothetical protein
VNILGISCKKIPTKDLILLDKVYGEEKKANEKLNIYKSATLAYVIVTSSPCGDRGKE